MDNKKLRFFTVGQMRILWIQKKAFSPAFIRRYFTVYGRIVFDVHGFGLLGHHSYFREADGIVITHPDIADFKAVANWVTDARAVSSGMLPLVAAGVALWSLLLWLAIRRNPSKNCGRLCLHLGL